MQNKFLAILLGVAFLFASAAAKPSFVGAQENREPTQVCTIVINIIGNSQYIDQDNIGPGVIQYISQELNISPTVVQTCIQEIRGDDQNNNDNDNNDGNNDNNDNNDNNRNDGNSGGGDANDVAAATVQYGDDEVIASTIPDKLLPNTGGSPLLLAVGGALLVVGLLLGRSVIKRS
jgi:hypothetical protein